MQSPIEPFRPAVVERDGAPDRVARIHRRKRRSARPFARRRKIAVGLIGMLLLVVIGGTTAAGYLVKRHADQLQVDVVAHAQRGAAEAEAGREIVSKANKDRNLDELKAAAAHFGAARTEFRAARRLADGDPLVRQALTMPPQIRDYVKPRIDTLDALCDMGVALADAGDAAAATDATLMTPAQDGHGGTALLALLQNVRPQVEAIRADLQRAAAAAGRVNPKLLPGSQRKTFVSTKESIAAQLGGLTEFDRLSPVITEVLGGNGPRSYLIANADPANLQGSGGFVGSYSIMSTNRGEMKLEASGDVASIDQPYPKVGQKGYIAPPSDLKQFADHGWRVGDGLVQPDFTVAGKTMLRLFQNETGKPLDGVIVIDPTAVAMLLDVTGPIAIPEYKTTVQSKDFAELVFQKEECRSCGNAYDGKRFISTVASHVIPQLMNVPSSSWGNLLLALNNAATQRHLQLYFNNPEAQEEMHRVGWSGGTVAAPTGGEYFREVENNYGDSKANHFVQRHFTLSLTLDGAGNLQHHLAVGIQNPTPAGYSGGQAYRCYLRLYIPDTATDSRIGNVVGNKTPPDEQPPKGLKFIDGWFQVNGFRSQEIPIDWATNVRDLAAGHHIYWQKQAGTQSDAVDVIFTYNGKTFKTSGNLSQDLIVVLTADGVKLLPGQAGGASLPTIGS